EGGIHSPAIVQWNSGLSSNLVGQLTDQVGDVRDLMPTLLDLAGVHYPEQWADLTGQEYAVLAEQGTSLAQFLSSGELLGDRALGWAHEGNRAYRVGNWKIVSSNFLGTDGTAADQWEMYDLGVDPTESNDLAALPQYAEQFAQLLAGYERWAYQTNVTSILPWSAADFNADGQLDQLDVRAFIGGWLQSAAVGSGATFARGDVNLDGVTNLDDFMLVRRAFGLRGVSELLQGVGTSLAVPEPSTSLLVWATACIGGVAMRRKRP
ncbi:MAG: PEP-CTERM sorting domain-containing protein, partial [Planctomycetales bacterium]|nr:PEP-CTERM sorting domain-containing protein [Planctomycetales bacterium]